MNTNSNTKRDILKMPKAYWALYHNDLIMYQGTHTDCWSELLRQYNKFTVAEMQQANIRIARMN